MRHLFPLAAAALTLTTGCGRATDPGIGSHTLFVKALALSDGTLDGSSLKLEVRNGHAEGPLVKDAVVIARGDRSGELNIAYRDDFELGGIRLGGGFEKKQLAWDTGWSIEVKNGDDYLVARLEAPGATIITEPVSQTTYRRTDGRPLPLRWRDEFGHRAKQVTIDFARADYDRTFTEDAFGHDVAPNSLVPEKRERVTITRWNEVGLAGGVAGSVFKAQTAHQIDFIVE
jgi:hypothetical protein